ncbi:GNAT family N-acetyltransferase [Amylibacter sp. IMCC11727]|uniref:GNAT family N-acetyltransferase n=1 Tax=Amylibacter sp. IMCC11727 TaxID=3039851 RepID=UPI00244E3BEB|nr:GNAT family N-acetyltransferase [Amylibacter sp. IMCC11727]WGI21434.1 GNAT family N-acetyltransferase [Amylibacter sp. IMCC11727]
MNVPTSKVIHAGANHDWQAILDLLHTCFAYMETRIDPPSSLHTLTPADIQRQATNETLLLVFDADQMPIACTFLTEHPDCLYLGKMAVHPDHRGKGIAKALIDTSTDLARTLGHTKLRLQTRIELHENHAIFAHHGFVKTAEGTHPGFIRPTEITMEKTL